MTNVLFVQGNPKSVEQSVSLQLGQHFVETFQAASANTVVSTLDLYSDFIPLIDADVVTGWGKLAAQQDLSPEEAQKVQRLGELVDQFLASDVLVFAAPLWNFGYPPMVKAYMDAVAVAGKTFQYSPQGPVGLTRGKRAVILESRGGFYSGDAQNFLHSANYLKGFLGFLGVTEVETVFAEGLNFDPSKADEILAAAKGRAAQLAQTMAKQPEAALV
ncbi:NAD(P)H-dependent oxidoreductase [Deinococcus sp. HMF7604]|uniref:NAD(P)H-dependent oxidoreductase n=1 Tax=Deinococcus betulae TaxID=2873312 RepID=UPI001CC99735|nr:NAD(P)H-dependent oxidoreductase [Deinococcus betulae]MBZ9749628.1 NAD(P)H-dependent oxidoreductase [Deinococcus betulae]